MPSCIYFLHPNVILRLKSIYTISQNDSSYIVRLDADPDFSKNLYTEVRFQESYTCLREEAVFLGAIISS